MQLPDQIFVFRRSRHDSDGAGREYVIRHPWRFAVLRCMVRLEDAIDTAVRVMVQGDTHQVALLLHLLYVVEFLGEKFAALRLGPVLVT